MQQIGLVVAGRQGLRLQGAGVLQLLDAGELGLTVAGLSHTEAWGGNRITTLQQRRFNTIITQNLCGINSSVAYEEGWQTLDSTGKHRD